MSPGDGTPVPAVTVRVPASLDAPGFARRTLLERAGSVLDDDRLDDARLLISEVVTNAVRHAGLSSKDEIVLCIEPDGLGVRVEITDPGRGFSPTPRAAPTPAGGWGLPLLERLSDGWGVDHRDGGGSIVWFRVRSR